MQLKLVKPQDKDYLWKAYVKSMQADIEKIWGWELAWQKQDFESNLAKYNTCLIRQNDKTIGYVQYKVDDKQIYINMLILESSQQSQGIGGKILDYLIEENNLTSLSLRCFKVNKRAFNFYPNPGIETRIRVQSLGAYSECKKYVVTLLVISCFLHLLDVLRGCTIIVFSISGFGFYKRQGFVETNEDDVFYLLTKSMKQ